MLLTPCAGLQDFLGSQTRPPAWDGRNTTYMWIRSNNTARSVLNIRDASCGMWVRLPEGEFAGFSGARGAVAMSRRGAGFGGGGRWMGRAWYCCKVVAIKGVLQPILGGPAAVRACSCPKADAAAITRWPLMLACCSRSFQRPRKRPCAPLPDKRPCVARRVLPACRILWRFRSQ
jgi:hypothetical protein